MRAILQKRALRFVLLANVVSMLGSGMNAGGFAIIGSVYLVAFISGVWPIGSESPAIPDVLQ